MQFIKQSAKDPGPDLKDQAIFKTGISGNGRTLFNRGSSLKQIFIYILIVAVIIIIGALLLFGRNSEKFQSSSVKIVPHTNTENSVTPAIAKSPAVATPSAANAPVVPTNPASPTLATLVRAVNVEGNLQNTRLNMYLNKSARFYVSRDAGNILNLYLDNSQMAEPLLPLNTKNTLIKAININNSGNQLKVSLTLLPATQITQLRLNDQTATPQLMLDLGSQNQTVNTSNSVVVTDNQTVSAASLLNGDVVNKSDLNSANSSSMEVIEKTPVQLTSQEQAEQAYQTALSDIQNDQLASAEATLRKLLKQVPDYAIARQALVTLLLQQNNLQEAQQVLQDGMKLQPNYPNFTQLTAQILLAQGKTYAALKKIQTLKPVLIEYPDYYAFAAALYQRTGHFNEAASIYSRLVAINSNNSVWWLGLGIALDNMGKKNLALEAYQNTVANGNLNFELQNYVKSRISALGG